MKPNRAKDVEVVSFNREFIQFDVTQLGMEELERRLELALAGIPSAVECSVAECQTDNPSCPLLGDCCVAYCLSLAA
jgi:hypothetical protein